MKSSRADTHVSLHKIPEIEYVDDGRLTSYSGLVLFQALFRRLSLRSRLRRTFAHLGAHTIYGPDSIVLVLVLHILLGFRRLRGLEYYHDDPLVLRVCGLREMPSLATLSRSLRSMDDRGVDGLRHVIRQLVLDRARASELKRLTLDFDGSVQSTTGHAEGTAVGYNKKKKGARSYYPLFCTVAQTGQYFDMLHRPGNVHDSKGAAKFMAECFTHALKKMPKARLESRMDSAFYSDTIFKTLTAAGAEFSCSVPFLRIPALKAFVEKRKRWTRIDDSTSVFEKDHQAASWDKPYRLIFVRTKRAKQIQGPLQLHLFEPRDSVYEYKVFATNKTETAAHVLAFHNGRGSQERLFGEGKQHAALDVLATRTKVGNQLFTACSMLAHNLSRELQMVGQKPKPAGRSGWKARWSFLELGTLRQRLLHRAGVLTRPAGRLTLRMSANSKVSEEMTGFLHRLESSPQRSVA